MQQNGKKDLQATYVTKDSIPEYISNLKNSKEKAINPVKKWAKDFDRQFSEEYKWSQNT